MPGVVGILGDRLRRSAFARESLGAPHSVEFSLRKQGRATGVGNLSELGYWAYVVPTKYPIPRAAFAGKRVVPCVVPEGMLRLFST